MRVRQKATSLFFSLQMISDEGTCDGGLMRSKRRTGPMRSSDSGPGGRHPMDPKRKKGESWQTIAKMMSLSGRSEKRYEPPPSPFFPFSFECLRFVVRGESELGPPKWA